MNNFLLDALALGASLSGILVITANNPVVSVLFLITVFINVAGYLLILGVGFIGITYLIVYVGAIAILFLFVIMMLNLQLASINSVGQEYSKSLPLAALLGGVFLFEMVNLSQTSQSHFTLIKAYLMEMIFNNQQQDHLATSQLVFNSHNADSQLMPFLQVQSIGQILYMSGAVWLFLVSLILLLAMLGPILLTLNKKSKA